MRLLKKTTVAVASLVLSVWAGPGMAAVAQFGASITQVLVSGSTEHGGCMIKLDRNPRSSIGACGNHWLSMDCTTNQINEEVAAYRLLDVSQMALAMRKRIWVVFTDDAIINGYCVATRIHVNR